MALCLAAVPADMPAKTLNEGRGREERIDYAASAHVDDWLRHPVYGDPSFDSFKRLAGNPIHRGTPEYEWPVNGFLFLDPESTNWYVYVGDYKAGYSPGHSRVLLLRSKDSGKTWDNLGAVVEPSPTMFDTNGHTPDATVVYDGGRYHMVYDWVQPPFGPDGGLAYAWADRPEGPWHRDPEPITHNDRLTKLLGRYRRTYAGTLIRRKNDWLILAMLDCAPNSWALFAMTAKHPEGPYSERKLVRNVEDTYFYPPLMEYFPAFAHDGFVYASATSVALNRNFQIVCRAPIERAEDPKAWEISRYGSVWHSEDLENEAAGIWGQTFSGQVTKEGTLLALFNSRDPHNFGTVNMAERPWSTPLRPRGFHFSGHTGPSFTCISRAYTDFVCRADLKVRGNVRLVWGYGGALGPDRPASDATLHALTMTRYSGLELSASGWKVVQVDATGTDRILGAGGPGCGDWRVAVQRQDNGEVRIAIAGKTVWTGRTGAGPDLAGSSTGSVDLGPLGLYAAPNTHVEVTRFEVVGKAEPAHLNYLYTEGLLGAGEPQDVWEQRQGPEFRFGVGAVHRGQGGKAKWNFEGTAVRLWSPTGPEFGEIRVSVDGLRPVLVDLHAGALRGPVAVFERRRLKKGPHCLVVEAVQGAIAIDGVEVVSKAP